MSRLSGVVRRWRGAMPVAHTRWLLLAAGGNSFHSVQDARGGAINQRFPRPMPYGFYISAEGAHAQAKRLEILANNLANVDTAGFKRELAVFRARNAEATQRGEDVRGSGSLNDLGGGVLVLLWGLLSTLYPPLLLPSPANVLKELAGLAISGALWQEAAITIARLCIAYACATIVGVGLGLLAGSRPVISGLLRPSMSLATAVPPIAWLALALIWFGTGSLVPIVVAVLAATPAIYSATVAGMHTLDPDLTAAVKLYGLRGRVLISEYYLPALAPSLGGGMAMGASLVVRVGVMGEFLASASGIGSAMALARTQLDTARLLAWLAAALAFAAALDLATRPLLGHLTKHREYT